MDIRDDHKINRIQKMKSLDQATIAIQQLNISRYFIKDDGTFPNNGLLPLLIYKSALQSADSKTVIELFESNQWVNAWEDSIYDFDHYHSTAHEVLGVIEGTARLQFGGPKGITADVETGDVIIIPAGVAHRFIEGDGEFTVIGAYPEGTDYDLLKGEDGERPQADQNIKSLSLPDTDPVYGVDGPLIKNWKG